MLRSIVSWRKWGERARWARGRFTINSSQFHGKLLWLMELRTIKKQISKICAKATPPSRLWICHSNTSKIEWSGFLNKSGWNCFSNNSICSQYSHPSTVQTKTEIMSVFKTLELEHKWSNSDLLFMNNCKFYIATWIMQPAADKLQSRVGWMTRDVTATEFFGEQILSLKAHRNYTESIWGNVFLQSEPNISAISWKKNTEIRQRIYGKCLLEPVSMRQPLRL